MLVHRAYRFDSHRFRIESCLKLSSIEDWISVNVPDCWKHSSIETFESIDMTNSYYLQTIFRSPHQPVESTRQWMEQ